jgi:hypothetical protein
MLIEVCIETADQARNNNANSNNKADGLVRLMVFEDLQIIMRRNNVIIEIKINFGIPS